MTHETGTSANRTNHTRKNDESLLGMLRDAYSPELRGMMIFAWIWGLLLAALAIYAAVKFFDATTVKDLVLFASIFICCVIFLGMIKVFAWQVIHRFNIKREIRRLQNQMDELLKR